MKLTTGRIHDAIKAIVDISNRQAAIPMLAKYRFKVLHDRLDPVFQTIEVERVKLVQQFGEEKFSDVEKTKSLGWGLFPSDPKFQEYLTAWNAMREQEFTVPVTPIPLAMLGNDPKGGIEISEFKMLGELIVDNMAQEEAADGTPST
jgi:hypothetical protein